MKLYKELSSRLLARKSCMQVGNMAWQEKHEDAIHDLCRAHLPHGSGIDGKHCQLDLESSTPDRLVLAPADFHHMDEHGYDGWTEHTVIVTPSLLFGFDLKITGRDRNEIKDYLHDVFHSALSQEISKEDLP